MKEIKKLDINLFKRGNLLMKKMILPILVGALISLAGVFTGSYVSGAGEDRIVERDKVIQEIVSYQNVNSFVGSKKALELDNLSEEKLSQLDKNYKIIIVDTLESREGFVTEGVIEGNTIKVVFNSQEGVLEELVNKALAIN